jgi:integrase
MEATITSSVPHVPWNKDKLTGQKPPLKLREIWAIRIRLKLRARTRDLAMFNLAIDSKLRACDLTKLRVRDVCLGSRVAPRATVMQQKTQRPVQFEITEQTRESVEVWIKAAGLLPSDFLFPGRIHPSPHLSTRQYARLVHRWIRSIGIDDTAYSTYTMRRTKASLIYRRTKNLRAVQLLLGHTKLDYVRYLGIESTTRSKWRNRPRFEPRSRRTIADTVRPTGDVRHGRRDRRQSRSTTPSIC